MVIYFEIHVKEKDIPQGFICADYVNSIEFYSFLFEEYIGFIADRRLERIGLSKLYNTSNPFPWMSEVIDLSKMKNFFERKVTEYQNAGSLIDMDF